MKKFSLILFVFVMFCTSSYAQSAVRDKFSIGWEVGIPSNDFLSETSYSGGKIEYQRMIQPNLSVGISGSWNSFQQYVPKTTYEKADGSGAITTDIVKEVYSVPLTLNAKYYFDGGKKLTPYAGIGLGGQYCAQAIYFNIYGIEDNNWGFVARPELGVTYSLQNNAAIYLSGTYNLSTNKSDAFKTDNLNHIALSIGFIFGSY
jgi:outer membrane protein